jgi:transcriptional regulator with XRE-family HTH domain
MRRMTASSKLAKFIEDERLTQERFAEVPGPQVSLWISGKRKPGLESAFKLERATRGIIRADEWIDSDAGRAA